jgi:hypothetical protein
MLQLFKSPKVEEIHRGMRNVSLIKGDIEFPNVIVVEVLLTLAELMALLRPSQVVA